MCKGLRIHELDQMTHFTDGEAKWKQFATTRDMGQSHD